MTYVIDQTRCINCAWCRRECPTDTIHYFDQENRKHKIEAEYCIDCDICARVCPMSCISHDPAVKPDPEQLATAKGRARSWARGRRKLKLGFRAYAESQVLMIANGKSNGK
jgi:Pyruvate/2-oxoacid:ferredoxin oxidoreductase delta subunit